MIWEYIKEKWEWFAAASVALLAFAIGRSGKRASDKLVLEVTENKEKEIEIEKELSAEEKLAIAKAHQKYVNTRVRLRKEARAAKTELEKETLNRKLELLELAKEDPEAIDQLLMEELNIAKLK
jgi:hypothetical protein